MINILQCNITDLNTIIEINDNKIKSINKAKINIKGGDDYFLPFHNFLKGDLKRLQIENKQLNQLIKYYEKTK